MHMKNLTNGTCAFFTPSHLHPKMLMMRCTNNHLLLLQLHLQLQFCYPIELMPMKMKLTTGNEGGFFEMHDQTGDLFLVREVDLESLSSSVLSLQIQVITKPKTLY